MEWPKLKNIILLLLVCVNAVLLVLSAMQAGRSARYAEETRQAAVQALAQGGISFELERLPQDLSFSPLLVTRERESEAEVARLLLGEVLRQDENDVRHRYASQSGTAEFTMNGSFSVQFQSDGWVKEHERSYEDASRSCLERMGLSCSLVSAEVNGSSAALTFCQEWEGVPIFSCLITLNWQGDELVRIEGQRLSGAAVPSEGAPLSTAGILIRFLAGVNEGGYVCSRIVEMTPGYLISGSSRPVELTPVWRIGTDSGDYYVDAITGVLTPAGS